MCWASLMAQQVKNLPAMKETQETMIRPLCWEVLLQEEMATHSSILAGKIPWTEEPGELQSKGTQSLTQLSTQGKILTENAIIFHCVVVLFSKVVADVFI